MGATSSRTLAARPADVVVVDCLMFGAMHAAADAGLRYVALEHSFDTCWRRDRSGPDGAQSAAARG